MEFTFHDLLKEHLNNHTMTKAIYNEMTKTYRVDNADGTFNTYTPDMYVEKFGALPEEDEGTGVDELDGTDAPAADVSGETVTSVDGAVTAPVSEVDEALKKSEELSPEEQEKVKADQAAAVEQDQTPTGQDAPSTGGVLGAIKNAVTPNNQG